MVLQVLLVYYQSCKRFVLINGCLIDKGLKLWHNTALPFNTVEYLWYSANIWHITATCQGWIISSSKDKDSISTIICNNRNYDLAPKYGIILEKSWFLILGLKQKYFLSYLCYI